MVQVRQAGGDICKYNEQPNESLNLFNENIYDMGQLFGECTVLCRDSTDNKQ